MSGACWRLLSNFEYWKGGWEMQIQLQESVLVEASLHSASQPMPFFGGPVPSYLAYTCSLCIPLIYRPLFLPWSCLVSPFIHLRHLFSHNKHLFFILTLIPEPHYFCFWESGRTSMEGKRTCYYLDQGSSNEPPWEAGGAVLNTLSFPNINKWYMNKGQEPAFLARKDNADTSSAKWDSLLP